MINKQDAFKKITELVQRFNEQFDSYINSGYNETLTRRDFIDPFFKALGWDIDNEQGYAEAYREVIHEDRVKVGGATKAPDYSFRIGGNKRLFFVEAKKPSIIIKDDIIPAYQVRRYGWNAKLAISIVTDFEEFAVYDCTRKPFPTDKVSVARIKYLYYKDYLKEFDFIWETFSKEQVLKGSFDKFVQGNANKKGTATVDKDFLLSLDNWRTYLATSISWNNKELEEDEINFVVQQTIDRIIFLRIAEDRSIETYGNLQTSIKYGSYFQNLYAIFKEADQKYNSGLFDVKKDKISKDIKIDNKVIKTIINELYYPLSPYEFSYLSVEILGSAYEQFLGKVIRITPSHHAKIEEKPEVRKAGGVYYTPQYIVEYIVKNTIGKLIEGKTPAEISDIKIVDPACGSGSFLIGAFQYLLDWHKDYYSNNGKPSKGTKGNPITPDGHLTTTEKKRILLNNIYGVDIDVNAVEVTKLSLLLKCMEGETTASIAHQLSMFHEKVLPTLDNNIKDGNSLVDEDIYEFQLDFGEERKIKPLSWQKAFPEVFNRKISEPKENLKIIAQKAKEHAQKAMEYASDLENKLAAFNEPENNLKFNGGFDVVIGNPPYGALLSQKEDSYLRNSFQVANYQLDTYSLFIERGKKLLLSKGYLGFIIPSAWVASVYDFKLRKFITEETRIHNIVITPKQTFKEATVETCIAILTNDQPANRFQVERWDLHNSPINFVDIASIDAPNAFVFPVYTNPESISIIQKVKKNKKVFNDFAEVVWGVKVYEKGKGIPPQNGSESTSKIFHSTLKRKMTHRPLVGGSEISRYQLIWKGGYIDYGKWLAAPRKPNWFEGERILVREITSRGTIQATFINDDFVFSNSVDGIKLRTKEIDIKFLLGLLNSKLMSFYHLNNSPNAFKGTFPKILLQDLRQLPIPIIIKEIKYLHDDIVKFVNQLLKLHDEKATTKLQNKIYQLQSHIEYCEEQINIIVYKLYGLEKPEIEIIEENAK
jgi:type I restriction-modification system DNA methylase subunit